MKNVFLLMVFVLTGCMSDQQFNEKLKNSLKENPSILTDAIKENPSEIFKALQEAAQKAQQDMAKKREDDRKKDLVKYYDKPLSPTIRDDENYKGEKDAPIVLIEYSDFECPFCSRAYETVEKLMKKYEGKVKFIYKHLPLDFHKNARVASEYYEAIRLQDSKKAWEFHDKIFQEQRAFAQNGKAFLEKIAKAVGANMGKLKKDLKSDIVKKRIDQDIEEARKFGIQGTPGFVINGIPVKGAYPVEYFDQVLEELKKRGKITL